MDIRRIECLAAAACIAVTGYIHFKIWQHEYRHAPIREAFLAFVVASVVVTVLLVVTATRPIIALGIGKVSLFAGMILAQASLLAFAVSRGPGIPTLLHGTFKEKGLETTASYVFSLGSAKVSLVAETAAALLCGALLIQRRAPKAVRRVRAAVR